MPTIKIRVCKHPCEDYFTTGYCDCTDEKEVDFSFNEGKNEESCNWGNYDFEPEACPHCGKDYEDFSGYGCCYCDVRLSCQE